jgi:hypothetical protein
MMPLMEWTSDFGSSLKLAVELTCTACFASEELASNYSYQN